MRYPTALLPVLMVVLVTCKPDKKVQPAPPFPVDGRAKFVGTYDVYDTVGNYQYTMQIRLHPGTVIDSLYVENIAGAFDVYCQHHIENQSNSIQLGLHFGIADRDGHRWAFYSEYDSLFMHNQLINDTLRLSYLKDNIAFYVADGVPYFSRSYREYAVKRDWE